MKNIILILLPATLAALSPIAHAEDNLPNAKCPLMIDDDAETDHKISYQGKDIFLCCGTCEKQWAKDPDYYAALAKEMKLLPQLASVPTPATVKLLEQRFCPFTTDRLIGPSCPSVEYKGVAIYFSKPGHLRTWNESPDKYAQEAFAKGLLPQLKGKM